MEREQEDGAEADRGNDHCGNSNHKKAHGHSPRGTYAKRAGLPEELKPLQVVPASRGRLADIHS
jgi:hypothetical protein